MIDTNVLIAAFKSGYTDTTRLLLRLLLDQEIELIADEILLKEYKKWIDIISFKVPKSKDLAGLLYELLKARVIIVEPTDFNISVVRRYIPEKAIADIYHAATCLTAKAILISNDKDFMELKRNQIIEVWSITEAILRLL